MRKTKEWEAGKKSYVFGDTYSRPQVNRRTNNAFQCVHNETYGMEFLRLGEADFKRMGR